MVVNQRINLVVWRIGANSADGASEIARFSENRVGIARKVLGTITYKFCTYILLTLKNKYQKQFIFGGDTINTQKIIKKLVIRITFFKNLYILRRADYILDIEQLGCTS